MLPDVLAHVFLELSAVIFEIVAPSKDEVT